MFLNNSLKLCFIPNDFYKKTFLLTFLLLLISEMTFAQSIPNKRFEKSLLIFQQYYQENSEPDLQSLTDFMLTGPRRGAAFNLQSLGKIYGKYPLAEAKSFFKNSLRFETKSLEDAIGAHDKWSDLIEHLKSEQSSLESIELAQLNLKRAFDLLVYVLSGEKSDLLKKKLPEEFYHLIKTFESGKKKSLYKDLYWLPSSSINVIQQMSSDLKNFPFLDYPKDRKFVLNQLVRQLEKIKTTSFDFNLLEDSDEKKGLHEFRRELRWFSIQATNLNGTLNFKETCPNSDLKSLLDDKSLNQSPFTKLPQSPFKTEKVCRISKCLFYNLTKTISDIGVVKDEVEKLNYVRNLDNKTPKEQSRGALKIYNDFMSSKTIDLLIEEINECTD